MGDVLNRLLRQAGLETRLKRLAALKIWPEVVGQPAARKCRAVAVREGVLIVSTSDSVWANVLTMEKMRYLERLQERLGKGTILDIRFSTRAWREQSPPAPRQRKEPLAADMPLDDEEKQAIIQMTSQISDPELKDSAARGLAALMRVRKWRFARGWKRCKSCGRLHRGGRPQCPGRQEGRS